MMRLATTTSDFYYLPALEDQIKAVAEAGFKYVDISFCAHNNYLSPFMQDNWKEYTLSLKRLGEDLGIQYVQSHCPDTNPLDTGKDRETYVEVTRRSIEVSALLNIPNTVFHTGWKPDVSKEEYFEQNLPFMKLLFPVLEETGVDLCVENSTRANLGEQYFFFNGNDMVEFIDYVGHPNVKACWDVGHANIEGHQYDDILALGNKKYLSSVHIHDNRGKYDEHLMPYLGTLNVDEVMRGLLAIDYQGYFTFEADGAITNAFRGLERWSQQIQPPPNVFGLDMTHILRSHIEKMLYELGKNTLMAYGCFEN